MPSATGKKKMKWTFQTKKGFTTCSKLIINELGRCPTRSNKVYFADNEQTLLAFFTAVFCLTHAGHNKLNLDYIIIEQRKL